MAKYLDENGAEQLNQLLAAKFDTKVDKVLNTKTYENILGKASDTSWNQNTFYFASVRPTSFTDMWSIKYRISVWVESDSNFNAVSDCFFRGDQSGISAYSCFNNIHSTSYRPAYYHTMYRLLEAGFNEGYGHAIGVSLKDANSKDTVGKERTIKVELLEQINCTVTLLDTPLKWGDWPGISDTNYNGATGNPTSYNFSANGLQETGDANDNTIAYIIKNYYEKPIIGAGNIYRNNLCTYDTDWKIQGFVKSNSTGTSKQKNTATFKIGMPIFYLNSTSNQTVGGTVADNILCTQHNSVDFRYSSNCGTTLVQNQPVFLVGIPDGDTFILADTWWTQTLPSTEDGKIYIYLGNAYSTNKYSIAFQLYHPIYWYKNGAIRLYTDDTNYMKPTGGIPKTDLTSDVQTSLGKADTALQSYTETDPTVPSHVKNITSTDISNWNAKGSGTITGVSVNGTSIATSGVANITSIPAAILTGTVPSECYTDTKNTAGSTDTLDKIYLIGATSQAANPQTYSDNEVFAQDGVLNAQELTIGSRQSGTTIGIRSSALGIGITASGDYSHAEGVETTASGEYSHAEGYHSTASGRTSHVEGWSTASGDYSHAEGYQTTASGSYSHSEGRENLASGNYSHAEGSSTIAQGIFQHVEGKYNIASGTQNSYSNNSYIHIVGNGSDNNRSNAHTLDLSGNAWFAGNVYVGSTSGKDKDAGSKKLATEEYVTSQGYTTNTGTITGVSVNGTSVATSGVANITSVPASILNGAIPSAVTATTQSASDNSTKIATTAFVQTVIDNLPEPMVFKGSLGTGGTITTLPTNGTANIGDTYKVITAGTYASKAAKVGDTFICLTKTSSANTWELIPSGDEPSGTVTSVTIKATSPISIDSTSAITTSGTRTLSHAASGVTAGTYRSITVNDTGHVTAGTNPTTISGYGITDAKIVNGTITLGSNTITPLISHQDISGKENISNKVTSLSSSSTDVQYPSAKTVYNYGETKQNKLTAGTGIDISGSVISSKIETTEDGMSIEYIEPGIYYIGGDLYYTTDDYITGGSDNYILINTGALEFFILGVDGSVKHGIFGQELTELHLDGFEDIDNKITSLSSSSTDTQYPSAKLVYDQLETKAVKNHASKYTTFGIGNETYYGHTKIRDDLNATKSYEGEALSSYQGYLLDQRKEAIANKVTSLSSSSTNTQYPSAKCVYDSIDAINTEVDGKVSKSGDTMTGPLAGTNINLGSIALSSQTGSRTISIGNIQRISGDNSLAVGKDANVQGNNSASIGEYSSTAGANSFGQGYASSADRNSASATGYYVSAAGYAQHVQGMFNVLDNSGTASTRGTYAHIVGNGTGASARSNAHTLGWDGTAWFAKDVYVGSTSGTNKDAGSKKLATENYVENQLLTKQTKIATDLTADLYLVDGTAPTLTSGTYYSNGHTISVNGTIFNDLTDTIFYVDNDIDSGTCLFNKLFGPGYIMAQIWYKEDGETEVYTTYNSNPLLYSNIDTSIPNIARDTRVPSTKLLKDQLALKTDTKNTAGSTDTSNKIYLIGATSQAANPQTYSDNEVFVQNGSFTIGSRKSGTLGTNSYAQGNTVLASGNYSHAEGYNTTASGYCSHAEGQGTTASNQRAHAEGANTTASATDCHAEGLGTTASATGAHAEGNNTQASNSSAHAEGYGTTASGGYSHAEGYSTIASGWYSHAEGNSTIAQRENQHVEGKYNIADSTGSSTTNLGEYLTIAGNGTADDARSNAYTLDWNGNAWFSGDVYVGSTSGTNKDSGSKKLATEEYVTTRGYITTDTKNTAGSTDTSSKIYLVGATEQSTNPQTYSDNEVYTISGTLTAKEFSLGTNAKIVYNTSENCIEFNFS